MRIKTAILAVFLGLSTQALADNMILDFETIEKIELNLKPNQTLMIDHKRGVLLGIMEITPSGAIKQLPIPKELLGKSEADIMGGAKGNYESSTSHIGGTTTTIYTNIKGKAKSASGKEKAVEDSKAGVKKRESGTEWDKSKIIYEQQEEVLDILR